MFRIRVLLGLSSFLGLLLAQPRALRLEDAVRRAAESYPAVNAARERMGAAAAGIQLARASYLPRADFFAQANRATHNNVYGLVLPLPLLAPISGPVIDAGKWGNVWGTALGVLVSWEPFDFGLRKASVETAEAARRRAEASVARSRFEVTAAAADAFLTILAAGETAAAAGAAVERADVLERIAGALVRAELRPGADLARARSEAALAKMQVIRAEEAIAAARAALAELLGMNAEEVRVEPGALLGAPAEFPAAAAVAGHPVLEEQEAAVEEARARQREIDRSWYPQFSVQATTYARGSGAHPDGQNLGGASGLGPNTGNWALGMTVKFPALEFKSLRARNEMEQHRVRAEQARSGQLALELKGRLERARAALEGARRIAAIAPSHVAAMKETHAQAAARYQAGLGTLLEVADAQRLLAQAEIDGSLANLNVRRAALAVAAAQGDLEPFLRSAQ